MICCDSGREDMCSPWILAMILLISSSSFLFFWAFIRLRFNTDSLIPSCTSYWINSESSLLLLKYPCSLDEDDTVDMSSLSLLSKAVGTCTILTSSILGVTQWSLMESFLVEVLLVLFDFDDLEPKSSLELFFVAGVFESC